MANEKRVGLVVGREWSWPPAFIEAVRRRDAGVVAELAGLDILHAGADLPYDVLIDRISHDVPFYRSTMKAAAIQGVVVINNPFLASAQDKHFGAGLAARLGIAHPRTVVLPNHSYGAGVDGADLANLEYPLDWHGLIEHVGLPAILKDAHGGRGAIWRVDSLDELIQAYDETGQRTMVLQELIEWDHYVRCMCIGQERILPMRYDPGERRYHLEHAHMSDALGATVVAWAQAINRALGYDMNAVEFAVRDGEPYVIDLLNPAPDMDSYALSPHDFDWVVDAMAELAISHAVAPRLERAPRWDALLAAESRP